MLYGHNELKGEWPLYAKLGEHTDGDVVERN